MGCGVSGEACPECFTLGHAWGRTGAWAARVLERGGESRAWSKEMGSSVGESKRGAPGIRPTSVVGREWFSWRMPKLQAPRFTLYARNPRSSVGSTLHAPRPTLQAASLLLAKRPASILESQENKSGILGNYVKIKSRRGLLVIFSNVGKAEKMT